MTDLAEVYEGLGEEVSRRRLYAGSGLFAAGVLLLVAGVVLAVVGPLQGWQTWEPAGVLVGLGLPAVCVGVVTAMPAEREVRAAAVVAASVAVLGAAVFATVYPAQWIGSDHSLAAFAGFVYVVGAVPSLWCLVTTAVDVEPRTDPGRTVNMTVTRGGETRTVEVDDDDDFGWLDDLETDGSSALEDPGPTSGTGSFGTSGDVTGSTSGVTANTSGATASPDGALGGATGTADSDSSSESGVTFGDPDDSPGSSITERTAGAVRSATGAVDDAVGSVTGSDGTDGGSKPRPASDGGATEPGIRSPVDDAEVMSARSDPADTTDTYCGNCKHFEYVQTSRGIRPFCELDDGIMDDVDACDRWEPNRLD